MAKQNQSLNVSTFPPLPMNINAISIASATAILASLGNLFLLYILLRSTRKRMGPVHILISNNCAADIGFALCSVLPMVAGMVTFPNFYGNNATCKLVRYLQLVPMYASPYLLIALAIDRFIAICRPLQALTGNIKRMRAVKLGTLAWLAALLSALPQIFLFHSDRDLVWRNKTVTRCYSNITHLWVKQAYAVYFCTLAWIMPVLVTIALYARICLAVYTRSNQRKLIFCSTLLGRFRKWTGRKSSPPMNRTVLLVQSPCELPPSTEEDSPVLRSSNQNHIQQQHRIKTLQLVLTIEIAFCVLWSPFCITELISAFYPGSLNRELVTYILLAGNLNSCVNPWIYLFFNRRQDWLGIFCCSFCRNSNPYSDSNSGDTLRKRSRCGSRYSNCGETSGMTSSAVTSRCQRSTSDRKINGHLCAPPN